MNLTRVYDSLRGPTGAGILVALVLVVALPGASLAAGNLRPTPAMISADTSAVDLTGAVTEATAEAEKKAIAEAKAAAKAKAAAASSSTAGSSGRIVPTRNYQITATYGQSGGYWSGGHHTGLDFAAPVGTPVFAAMSGTVVEAGWGGSYGNYVLVKHGNGHSTMYAHLNTIGAGVGQSVSAGQQIGTVGTSGNVTGAHLHFEVLDAGGNRMNPRPWLGI